MMSSKTPHLSYPGELPDLDHQTISLRTQLRLNYETYSWLRYATWSGLLLLAVLLVLLPGGFPPPSLLLFLQTLPVFGRLLAMHGSAALLSLLALGVQALTWLVLWVVLLGIANTLGRYTWRMHKARKILASGWLSSSALSNGQTPITLARTTPLHPKNAPDQPPQAPHSDPRKKAPPPPPAQPSSHNAPGQQPLVRSLAQTPAQAARSFAPSSPQAPARALADNSTQVLARPAGE
ncbi:MAG TPA: hypothetical protein VHD63_20535, partial [Ktedonobacteraceae bacterium]|nr:hypothetical protein [Ktedonobacteraceae bacterium]